MNRRHTLPFLALGVGISITLLLFIFLAGFIRPSTYAADDMTVCPDGTCDYTTIQAAVDAAGEGDLIKVAEGIYAGVSVRPRQDILHTGVVTQVVYIDKSVNIQGGYSLSFTEPPDPVTHPTIINPQSQGRGVYITGYISPTIVGLQITEGDARNQGGLFTNLDFDSGGGVFVISATATIRDCKIFSNTVDAPGSSSGVGGGLYLANDHAIILNNEINFNTSSTANGQGAGLYLNNSSARIERNLITNNATGSNGDGGALTIFDGNPTVISNTISGNHASRSGGGIDFSMGGATIAGNTLEGNTAGVTGGALNGYGDLTITNNTIYSNTAASGGGLFLQVGTYTVSENRIRSNTALGTNFNQGGGGIFVGDSTITLNENEITDNTANSFGGGVYLYDSSGVSISQNHILGNNASAGGGIYLFYTTGALDANTLSENLATDGAGLYLDWSDVSLTNNLVAENAASGEGGGLYIRRGQPELFHTTIVSNTGASGVYVTDYSASFASADFANTILVNHALGIYVDVGNTATMEATIFDNTVDFSGGGTFNHTNDLFGDPFFMDPAAGDFHIQSNSIARDSGVNVFVTTDIDGQGRPQGSGVDIGADEYHPVPSLSVAKHASPSQPEAGMPLIYTIVLTNTGNTTLTATVTDTLPAHVTPSGTLVWNPPPIGFSEIWTKTIVVTVDPGYIGFLTNQVTVSTLEGPIGSAVNTVSTATDHIYLPMILQQP
jgi:uncharacterized repeat protein (TIGR01451 family)